MTKKKEYAVTRPMHNPPHPGAVLKTSVIDALDLTVKDAAVYLDVDRITLSRVINQQAAVSVEMALRLAKALNGSPNIWLNMQRSYDVWQAQHNPKLDLSRVKCFETHGQHALA